MLTAVLDLLSTLPATSVIGVVALLLVVESGTLVGVALPGTTLLVGLGLWSYTAPGTLLPAIAAAAAGTVLGAHLAWYRGRSMLPVGSASGRSAVRLRVARLVGWMAGRGPATVGLLLAVGHWAAAARSVMPRVAAAGGTPYRMAGPVLAVTGTAWAATLVVAGNRLGGQLLAQLSWLPVAAVAALIVALLVRSSLGGPRRVLTG